jgi:hypothetical protein
VLKGLPVGKCRLLHNSNPGCEYLKPLFYYLFAIIKLFGDQSVDDMKRYFQGGSVAAYQHIAMLKLHYKIAHALDECLARLEYDEASPSDPPRRRLSQLHMQKSLLSMASLPISGDSLLFRKLDDMNGTTHSNSVASDGYIIDDEHEKGGFDGVECAFGPKK